MGNNNRRTVYSVYPFNFNYARVGLSIITYGLEVFAGRVKAEFRGEGVLYS
jgi:hypothetical protein